MSPRCAGADFLLSSGCSVSGLRGCVTVQRWLCVWDTMSGFSSEERAAPFTLEYRVFLSE